MPETGRQGQGTNDRSKDGAILAAIADLSQQVHGLETRLSGKSMIWRLE